MNKVICPVKNCKGFETFSANENISNHIKNLAKTELLNNFVSGTKNLDHAIYIKENSIIETKTVFKI